MRTIIPIGICAGLASALIFSSLTTGSVLALILFYLVPLPLFIAGLGWGHKATAIAGIVGLLTLFFVAPAHLSILFFGAVALPATVLTYFALLSRQSETGAKDEVEWYPLGRLVVVSAIFATGFVALALGMMGGDLDQMYKNISDLLSAMMSQNASYEELKKIDPGKADSFLQFTVRFAPAGAAAMWLLTTLMNMFAAQKILKASKKAIRTEVDIAGIVYPQLFLISFAASLALTFIGGLPGLLGGAFAAVGIMAYAILGFIVIHKITKGHTFRPLMLGLTYLMVLMFSWFALVVMMGIGLFDSFFGLREKFGKEK